MMIGLFRNFRRRSKVRHALEAAKTGSDALTKCARALDVLVLLDRAKMYPRYRPLHGQRVQVEIAYPPIELLSFLQEVVIACMEDRALTDSFRKQERKPVQQSLDDWLWHGRETVILSVYLETLVKVLQPLIANLQDAQLCRPNRYSYYARVVALACNDLVNLAAGICDLEVILNEEAKRRP